MHIVRFRDQACSVQVGEWIDDRIVHAGETHDPTDVAILPPVEPTKIVCLATNYVEHIREGGRSIPEDIPDRPHLFLKGPNTVAGHGDTIHLPTPGVTGAEIENFSHGRIDIGDARIDYEAELGVVIGEQCRHIPEDKAMDVVQGFTCVNDVSNRDDQAVERNWVRGKAFDNSAPMGPVIATPEHVPADPRIQLRLNGETRQDSADDELIFSVEAAIAEITTLLTLEPGDVIAMGTPVGVGPLRDGDTVDIEIEGIGTLTHYVAT